MRVGLTDQGEMKGGARQERERRGEMGGDGVPKSKVINNNLVWRICIGGARIPRNLGVHRATKPSLWATSTKIFPTCLSPFSGGFSCQSGEHISLKSGASCSPAPQKRAREVTSMYLRYISRSTPTTVIPKSWSLFLTSWDPGSRTAVKNGFRFSPQSHCARTSLEMRSAWSAPPYITLSK
jgi:hypothetical protein